MLEHTGSFGRPGDCAGTCHVSFCSSLMVSSLLFKLNGEQFVDVLRNVVIKVFLQWHYWYCWHSVQSKV